MNIRTLLHDPAADLLNLDFGSGGGGARTCILLAWVLLGDAGGRGLRKLELLHHLGGQETHCRTVNEYTE